MTSFRFKLFLSLVTLLGMCARIDAATCPQGWGQPFNVNGVDYCYRVEKHVATKTWQEARTICQQPGNDADLVTINSKLEKEEVFHLFTNFNQPPSSNDRLLIGLNKPTSAPDFQWPGGSTVPYSVWAPDETSLPSGDLVVVLKLPTNGQSPSWEVVSSTTKHQYSICKKMATQNG